MTQPEPVPEAPRAASSSRSAGSFRRSIPGGKLVRLGQFGLFAITLLFSSSSFAEVAVAYHSDLEGDDSAIKKNEKKVIDIVGCSEFVSGSYLRVTTDPSDADISTSPSVDTDGEYSLDSCNPEENETRQFSVTAPSKVAKDINVTVEIRGCPVEPPADNDLEDELVGAELAAFAAIGGNENGDNGNGECDEPLDTFSFVIEADEADETDETDETDATDTRMKNILANTSGLTGEQRDFAIFLDNMCGNLAGAPNINTGTIDLRNGCNELLYASEDDARAGIIAWMPVILDAANDISFLFDDTKSRHMLNQMRDRRRGGGGGGSADGLTLRFGDRTVSGRAISALLDQVAGAGGGASADDDYDFERLSFFISGTAGWGDRDETNREAGFDFNTTGITAGVDYLFAEGLILGAALGYGNTDADMDASAGDLDTNGWSLSAYGTYYTTDRFYLEGTLTYGWNQYDQSRNITYSLLDSRRTAKADFDGNQFSVLFGGGYDFHMGPGIFDLYGRVNYVNVDIDSYTEYGAQGLDLVVDDQSATSFKGILGVQYSRAFSTAKAVLLPQAWLQWEHEFESSDDNINGFFANDPNRTAFALATDSFDTNIFRLGLGLGAQFAEGRTGYLSYEAVLGATDYTEHKFTAGVNLSF